MFNVDKIQLDYSCRKRITEKVSGLNSGIEMSKHDIAFLGG